MKKSYLSCLTAVVIAQMAVSKTPAGATVLVNRGVSSQQSLDKQMQQAGKQAIVDTGDVEFGRVGNFGGNKPRMFKYTGGSGGTYVMVGDTSGSIAAKLPSLTFNDPATCPLGSTTALVNAWQERVQIKPESYKALKFITSSDADQYNNPFTYYWIDQYDQLQQMDLEPYIQAAANPMAENDLIREFNVDFPCIIGTDSGLAAKVDENETLTILGFTLLRYN